MFKIKTAARLAIFVAMIVGGDLWLGIMLKMVPDPSGMIAASRLHMTELIALSTTEFVETNRSNDLKNLLGKFVERNDDLKGIGVRNRDGTYRFTVGSHVETWNPNPNCPNQLEIAISANGRKWGSLEICFAPAIEKSGLGYVFQYPHGFITFSSALTCLLVWLTFTQTFQYLDPAKVVPGRVRNALDSLAEGLILLDSNKYIVHANEAFSAMVGIPSEELIGGSISTFVWTCANGNDAMPWDRTLATASRVSGELLHLNCQDTTKKYNVNSNPILDANGSSRGVLISFDDVTVLEHKKQDLAKMIDTLRVSRDEIKKQNSQLRFLASRDPLTKCYNRRSFWELYEQNWHLTPKDQFNIIMVDIDHFKSINDNFGHSKGDEVLREVGALLLELIGDHGIVCRYGGEEMAIMLANLDFEAAVQVANAIHESFQRCQFGEISITASIGISNRIFGAMDSQHLLDQADQCLYSAKRNGRNQVVRYDRFSALTVDRKKKKSESHDEAIWQPGVSYSTAISLFSTLAYRDRASATHSLQLADLCVGIGRKLLDPRLLYLLEVSALLHEIGQVGIVQNADESEEIENRLEYSCQTYMALKNISCEILGTAFTSEILQWIILSQTNGNEKFEALSAETKDSLHLAMQIMNICDQFLHHLETAQAMESADAYRAFEVLELDDCTQAQIVAEALGKMIADHKVLPRYTEEIPMEFPAQSAAILALHVQDLCSALADKDVEKLRKIIAGIQDGAMLSPPSVMTDTVGKLHAALEKRDTEFDDLLLLSDKLLDLCRSTRASLLGSIAPVEAPTETAPFSPSI